eukprot:COSAG01_NODE_633_length_14669_cov_7.174056_14_plen_91_part_00
MPAARASSQPRPPRSSYGQGYVGAPGRQQPAPPKVNGERYVLDLVLVFSYSRQRGRVQDDPLHAGAPVDFTCTNAPVDFTCTNWVTEVSG